jgi:hypothetical protein
VLCGVPGAAAQNITFNYSVAAARVLGAISSLTSSVPTLNRSISIDLAEARFTASRLIATAPKAAAPDALAPSAKEPTATEPIAIAPGAPFGLPQLLQQPARLPPRRFLALASVLAKRAKRTAAIASAIACRRCARELCLRLLAIDS